MDTIRIRRGLWLTIPALAFAALTAITATPAQAQKMPPHSDQVVQVSVSLNTLVPIPDLSEQTLIAAQKQNREMIYRLAQEECGVLMATIAQTCRLNNVNVSARVRNHHNQRPLSLYINGSYRFTITLKER